MQIMPITELASRPSIGMLTIGDEDRSKIFETINENYVRYEDLYGADGIPFAQQFDRFKQVFVDTAYETQRELVRTDVVMYAPDEFSLFEEEEDLMEPADCMIEPILTDPFLNSMFHSGAIDGWGVDRSLIIEEVDPYENQLGYGVICSEADGTVPDSVVWVWTSEDSTLLESELDCLRHNRNFVRTFIAKQLQSDLRDPTDLLDDGLIGNIED